MQLPMPTFTLEKGFDKTRASIVVKKVESEGYTIKVCEWACKSFASVSAHAMQSQQAELMADFLDGGACEALVTILEKFSLESEIVAAYGCATVLHLSWSSVELREFLGIVGACEMVVYAMSSHIGDPDVSSYGSGALGVLANTNISNSLKISEANGCDMLAQVGNFGFNLRHPKCSAIAANVCFALAQLCEAINVRRLVECGAADLVTQLIRLHFEDETVTKCALRALCGFASLNFQIREALGQAGACKCIVDVIKKYGSKIELVQEVCETILHLSLSPVNALKLSEAGACEVLVESLRDKLMDYPLGAEVCCGAMLNLVTYGIRSLENRTCLVELGAVDQIRNAKMSTKASYRARESATQLLLMLGAEGLSRNGSMDTLSCSSDNSFRGIVHACEAKPGVTPLGVEIHQYESFGPAGPLLQSDDDDASSDPTQNGIFEI